MDLTTIISIYGQPTFEPCPKCNGSGCLDCGSFGYVAHAGDGETLYTFTYPMYVELQKRDEASFLHVVLLVSISAIFIFCLIASYMINIAHG